MAQIDSKTAVRPYKSRPLKKGGKNYLEKATWRFLSVFLFPSVVLVGFFIYYPSVMGIIMSFQKYSSYDIYHTPFIGLQNYANVLAIPEFLLYWGNTAIWVVGCVAAECIIGFSCALLLQKDFFGKRIYESVIFVPWALSGFTVGVIFRWVFNGSYGLLNDILFRAGLITKQIGFLSSRTLALPSVMAAKVWTGMAFFAIVIMAALKMIPKEQYESAEIDGAGRAKKLISITIPNIRIVLVFTTILRVIATFGNYDLIFGMTGGGPGGASHTVTSWIMMELLRTYDYGRISAFGVITWLVLLFFSLIYMTLTRTIGDKP
jgi:multiple sugar transport system permease protein